MHEYKIKEIGVPMMAICELKLSRKGWWFAYSQIASRYNGFQFAITCSSYDAAYLIGIALDCMINQGFDYNDPYQINLAIRAKKFTWCTRVVSIDKSSIERVMDAFDIMACRIDTNSENVTTYKMGEFRPYGCTILSTKLL